MLGALDSKNLFGKWPFEVQIKLHEITFSIKLK